MRAVAVFVPAVAAGGPVHFSDFYSHFASLAKGGQVGTGWQPTYFLTIPDLCLPGIPNIYKECVYIVVLDRLPERLGTRLVGRLVGNSETPAPRPAWSDGSRNQAGEEPCQRESGLLGSTGRARFLARRP